MYAILKKAARTPRMPGLFKPEYLVPGRWAIDLETNGLDATDPAYHITMMGLANATRCFYIPASLFDNVMMEFLSASTFTAFNVIFDGAFLQKFLGSYPSFFGCSYGLFKQLSAEGFRGQRWNLETLQRNVLGWPTSNKEPLEAALKAAGLTKTNMSDLPDAVLGPYCASDADAAWQAWEELSAQATQFPALLDYHTRIFLPNVELLVEQQFAGITIDQELLQMSWDQTVAATEAAKSEFFAHNATAAALAQRVVPKKDKGFNLNSPKQLRWLFFDAIKMKPTKMTPAGLPSVGAKALPYLGTPGKLLTKYRKLKKRTGYIKSVQKKSSRDNKVHAQFNSVGTMTTRLSGSGGLNLQQMPKVPDFLAAFLPPAGHVLVQADIEALEPTVIAEFSQDKTLLSVYGPGAPPNDIYLVLASKIDFLNKEIKKYYDPDAPTIEGIALAKKHCKDARAIAKECKLSYDYGAQVRAMHERLQLHGVDIKYSAVSEIRADMDKAFVGMRRFEADLKNTWYNTGGYIISALGTPLCVAGRYEKDMLSRFAQSSGHLILQLWIANIKRLRDERAVPMVPWLADFHDEIIFSVPTAHKAAAALVFSDALALTNAELGMGVQVKAPHTFAKNFAEIKCPDTYKEWRAAHAG